MINRVLLSQTLRLTVSAIAAAGALAAAPAQADTLFFDNFEDGDVSDWTLMSNSVVPFAIATTDAASGNFAMETYFVPSQPLGGTVVGARKNFTISQAFTNVVLTLSGKTVPCDTCLIQYEGDFTGVDVNIDGASFTGTDLSYTSRVVALPDLAAGTYSLRLGVFASQAFAGRFSAKFDDVAITGTPVTAAIPEPTTWALMILGFGGAGVAIRRRRAALAA
jgi:hypothetical protein